MIRDLALSIACVTAFALALFYVAGPMRTATDRDRQSLTGLAARVSQLEQRFVAQSGAPGGPAVDPASQAFAIETLRRLRDVDLKQGIDSVEKLINSAKDSNATQVALRSMSLLGEVQDPAAVAMLERYARGEPSVFRVHAAKLLKRRGDAAALTAVVAELSAELQGSADVPRKVEVLTLLRFADEPASAATILPVLQDPNGALRRGAIMALSGFEDASVQAALKPLLHDPDPSVQRMAQRVLNKTP